MTANEASARRRANILLHFRPRSLPPAAVRFSATFGLGGIAALLALVQLLTGLLLKVFYKPVPYAAWESVQFIQHQAAFGSLIRGMHHWSGHLLIVVVLLHLLRVVYTGSWRPPRHANWLVGLGLGLLVLSANFTGYLLPWDQLSLWAVTISTAMLDYVPLVGQFLQEVLRGGPEVGQHTLQLFYSLHTAYLPVTMFVLIVLHFWYVRRNGGIAAATRRDSTESTESVPYWPDLAIRELAMAAVVLCVVTVLAVFAGAQLGEMANPAFTPEMVRAPWYFRGLQELLIHVPPVVAAFLLPLGAAAFLIAVPYVGRARGNPGVWFGSPRGLRQVLITAALSFIVTFAFIMIDELSGHSIIPDIVLLLLLVVAFIAYHRLARPAWQETVQVVLTWLVVALVVLTIVGTTMRGPAMTLRWLTPAATELQEVPEDSA